MGISKQTFLQRRHTDGQKAREKIFNITNYQRNTKLQWGIWPLLCCGRFLLSPFFESFYHIWVLTIVKGFFCIYWDDCVVFIFHVNMVHHTDLHILKNPCIPGINLTWLCCMSSLMCCWILFARFFFFFLRILASMFIGDTGL